MGPGQVIRLLCVALALIAGAPASGWAQDGEDALRPVLRYASLASDRVHMRRGPGTRFPIQWVYRRSDWPVAILAESDNWRLVRDADGVEGWIHRALLSGRRHAVVTGASATLRRAPDAGALPIARLQPGVVVALDECGPAACQVSVADYNGYLTKNDLWGAD